MEPWWRGVDSFRYLGVHILQDLSWSRHTNSLAKKARQHLYHLRCLRDFRLPSEGSMAQVCVVQVRKKGSHMKLHQTTRTGITISIPWSQMMWTPTIPLRDRRSSWPRSMVLQWRRDPLDGFGGSWAGSRPDHDGRYSEADSTGSYLDLAEGYVEYGEKRGCSDVTLESDKGSDHEEDLLMEVEEVSKGKPPPPNDVMSSKEDEPPAPKALPIPRSSGASKQPQARLLKPVAFLLVPTCILEVTSTQKLVHPQPCPTAAKALI
ncbi:hypothetical protein P4O66_015984 [Electrophorus voltai]|uniref:Alkylated DNA repair protein AlkB homologue 8 N-terminal domain-containing protein n=1 Tax=Electrophorus voltai TaxID=2609070 RepID=A0AAD8YWI1_9TELE|nr:hypothetical protein P4O66_015984 [Electrophorus voltai]